MIHNENNVLTDDELVIVRGLQKKSKHAHLYMPNEYPHRFKVLNTCKIRIAKTRKQITKDPKRQKRGKKSHKKYIEKVKRRYTKR